MGERGGGKKDRGVGGGRDGWVRTPEEKRKGV